MENQNTPESVSGVATPIQSKDRFIAMDVLRGIAIMGILVMNIYAFAMPFPAYMNPLVMGGTDMLNMGTWFFTHLIFDQKFLSIFAMLYGAGMIMMLDRAEQKGAKFGLLFYRRSFWLLLFGMAHGYLIWFGDILFGYAFSGMVVFLMRKNLAKGLIVRGVIFLLIGSAIIVMAGGYMKQIKATSDEALLLQAQGVELSDEQQLAVEEWQKNRAFMAPNADDIQKDIEAYRGTYSEVVEHRIPQTMQMQLGGSVFMILWRAGGLMLIGMALMRLGIINGQREASFYLKMMLMAYGIGLPIMFYSSYDLYLHDFDNLYGFGWGMMPNYWGSIIIALGHIALVNYLYKSGVLKGIFERFAYVGRMAFTNYLSHSIVMTSIFYGYGLNLYTEIPRFYQMGFVAGLILLQLLLSKWWLQRYRFGPAEWLWRTLTYWKKQPMKP